MITDRVKDALMRQINEEMWTANLYLSMALDASHLGFKGVAHWFKAQYREELEHCFKIVEYLEQNFVKVKLGAIPEVQTDWGCPLKMFEEAMIQERKVTLSIHKLYEMAVEDKDFATTIFLQWFVTEQVQEEETVQTIIDEFKMVADDKAATFMLDQKLGSR